MIKFIRYCGKKNTIGINNRWIAQKKKKTMEWTFACVSNICNNQKMGLLGK